MTHPMIRDVVFSMILLFALASATNAQVELTYLSNEGFLLQAGESKILVDALFGDGLKNYPVVPREIREQMESAQEAFADVDLVFATHFHPDHFNAASVARYMRAQPKARFLSTFQAVEKVLAIDPELKPRVEGFWPGPEKSESRKVAGIRVQILRLHHGMTRRPEVQNLGFIIELGGLRVLHVGDTEVTLEDVSAYALDRAGIDLALLPTWFYVAAKHRQVNDLLGSAHRVVMHMGTESAPAGYFHPVETREGLLKVLGESHPNAWVPTEPLDRKTFLLGIQGGSSAPTENKR